MTIWVDADACPKVIKEILYRAAKRTSTMLYLVANQNLSVPVSPFIRSLTVPQGFDVADHEIVARINAGELLITADIPLAADAIAKGALVITPRGEPLTKETIGSRLSLRNFMDELRSSGVQTSGPPPLSQKERQQFANALDQWLHMQQS
ncbi:YaiI/YqxD family protein [Wohlfahrtiimonas chitiniclastica]|uniref:YaiI/YqxD family protein n=1 Tax=Wohlfahrtiimonas chitiniclastica TaxID=400946 RepID=UPI001BCC97FE|nr:YaiI/YqxD family protein [Wohlfahrtiimonas chitiniclastica]MBS7815681.1 YaiI/YqxD family protein [Wohlfahrtiimonas chitiniclastica]